MMHRITKIGFLANENIRYFILPESLEYIRDIILSQASTWYFSFSDEQLVSITEMFKKFVDYYGSLHLSFSYKLFPDEDFSSFPLYECLVICIQYIPKLEKEETS